VRHTWSSCFGGMREGVPPPKNTVCNGWSVSCVLALISCITVSTYAYKCVKEFASSEGGVVNESSGACFYRIDRLQRRRRHTFILSWTSGEVRREPVATTGKSQYRHLRLQKGRCT
jgi:hypothetical protein